MSLLTENDFTLTVIYIPAEDISVRLMGYRLFLIPFPIVFFLFCSFF